MMKRESERQRNRLGRPFSEQLVASATGCLEWTGKTDRDGYGIRGSRYGERRAHRYAYTLVHGDIPAGAVVMHSCDNPICCNPRHLMLGSVFDNIEDKLSKGRQARGEKNSHARLTADDVRSIRGRFDGGESQVDLAAAFGVTQSAISLITLRKNWRHV